MKRPANLLQNLSFAELSGKMAAHGGNIDSVVDKSKLNVSCNVEAWGKYKVEYVVADSTRPVQAPPYVPTM